MTASSCLMLFETTMLHQFFPPADVATFSFSVSGMRVPTVDGSEFHFTATPSSFTLDEKASKTDSKRLRQARLHSELWWVHSAVEKETSAVTF